MMKLVIEQGQQAGQEIHLTRPTILVGRGQDSDITLAEQGISRQHARLEQTPQGWTVVDLGTTNGTFVNGRRIPSHEPIALQPGDRLSIGSSVLALQRVSQPARAPSQARRHPLVLVAGAVLCLLVLAAIVALLVLALQPAKTAVPTPTQGSPLEQLITVVPVPTQLEEVVPSLATLIPTEFHILPVPATETPSPLVLRTQGEGIRRQKGGAVAARGGGGANGP